MQIGSKTLIGEATEYDKKRSVERKKVKDWLKSVSAFVNSFGGTLIWGIILTKMVKICPCGSGKKFKEYCGRHDKL